MTRERSTKEIDKKDEFYLTLREINVKPMTLTEKVISFLGEIGGLCHNIAGSKYKMEKLNKDIANEIEQKYDKQILAFESEGKLIFPFPLYNKKININLAKFLPRIIEIIKTTTETKIKGIACDLLHSITTFMIGNYKYNN